jgi:hypothetical protein
MTDTERRILEAEFDEWMLWISDECQRVFGKRPMRFHVMVSEKGGFKTACTLLEPDPQRQQVAWRELNDSRGSSFYLTMEYLVGCL